MFLRVILETELEQHMKKWKVSSVMISSLIITGPVTSAILLLECVAMMAATNVVMVRL
jgi:hypothetical protein